MDEKGPFFDKEDIRRILTLLDSRDEEPPEAKPFWYYLPIWFFYIGILIYFIISIFK